MSITPIPLDTFPRWRFRAPFGTTAPQVAAANEFARRLAIMGDGNGIVLIAAAGDPTNTRTVFTLDGQTVTLNLDGAALTQGAGVLPSDPVFATHASGSMLNWNGGNTRYTNTAAVPIFKFGAGYLAADVLFTSSGNSRGSALVGFDAAGIANSHKVVCTPNTASVYTAVGGVGTTRWGYQTGSLEFRNRVWAIDNGDPLNPRLSGAIDSGSVLYQNSVTLNMQHIEEIENTWMNDGIFGNISRRGDRGHQPPESFPFLLRSFNGNVAGANVCGNWTGPKLAVFAISDGLGGIKEFDCQGDGHSAQVTWFEEQQITRPACQYTLVSGTVNWLMNYAGYVRSGLVPCGVYNTDGVFRRCYGWTFHQWPANSTPFDTTINNTPEYFAKNFVALQTGPKGQNFNLFTLKRPITPRNGPFQFDAGTDFPDAQPVLVWVTDQGFINSVWRDSNNGFWMAISGFQTSDVQSVNNQRRAFNPVDQLAPGANSNE